MEFRAELDRPLGERTVVDGLSGRVIWSPEVAAGYVRVSELTPGDAEGFIYSAEPAVTSASCTRPNFQYFDCSVKGSELGNWLFVRVDRRGRMELADPETGLPFR